MKLVAIDRNLKAQKNAQDRIIKKGKELLKAFLRKKFTPKSYATVTDTKWISILIGGCLAKI